jgi:hypothetical protein
VIYALGLGLASYGLVLWWIARRGATGRIGTVLALLDAAWVIGVMALLIAVAPAFTAAGITAAVITSLLVAVFGVLQWGHRESIATRK